MLTENQESIKEPTHYRFVRSDGKTTSWRKIPKYGITGIQYTRARRDLGKDSEFKVEVKIKE